MRHFRRAPLALLVALLAGCPESETPGGSGVLADGGLRPDGGDGGSTGDPDAGRLRIVWPEPTLEVQGGIEPGLALSPDGHVTLAYAREGTLWAHRDPPAGEPLALGAVSGSQTEVRIFASPTEDRAFVAWTGGYGVSLTAGQPDGERLLLWSGDSSLFTLGGGWFGDRPALVARSSEVWYGGDRVLGKHVAFTVPIDTPEQLPLPEPRDEDALATVLNGFHYYDESETLLDLGDGTALMFDRWTENPPDNNEIRNLARWRHLWRNPLASGARANYLVGQTGTVELPGDSAAWMRAFALGGGKYALAWGDTPDTLVFDVFLAGFELDEDRKPVFTTAGLNLSRSTGMTDNSDFPIVVPAGDGRFWVAWRETAFGPRVALMSADFGILALGAPDEELDCNLSSSMGAVADAEGTLHLAAGFMDNADEFGALVVRYYKIALP